MPSFISLPETIIVGSESQISWGESADPEGTIASYVLQRKFDNESYAVIYSGTAQSSIDSPVPAGKNTIQYRVKAVDADGIESDWITSPLTNIIINTPPTISGEDGDLGEYENTKPELYEFTVGDAQGNTVTVEVKLDGKIIRNYQSTLNEQDEFVFSDLEWRMVLNGLHTIAITARDTFSAHTTRTLTFTKSVDEIDFYAPVVPFYADSRPTKVLINISATRPEGSVLQIWVCNNGNDDEPAWEDCTNAVLTKKVFNFINDEKTAPEWGVKLRVKLQRGSAVGDVFITSIGGNFR